MSLSGIGKSRQDRPPSGDIVQFPRSEVSPALTLVVTLSKINGVVVSRIAERTGMRAEVRSPEDASRELDRLAPSIVVLDGGAENVDCVALYPILVAGRRSSTRGLPRVIQLTTGNSSVPALGLASIVDLTVAKPITPDRLQPILADLHDQVRLQG